MGETATQRKRRLAKRRQKRLEKLSSETETEKHLRLNRDRERNKQARASETLEQRQARLDRNRQYKAQVRALETFEKRQERLDKVRQRTAQVRALETLEQRQARIDKIRQHTAQVRALETPEQRQTRLDKMRQHAAQVRALETPEQRQARLDRNRQHKAQVLARIDADVTTFEKTTNGSFMGLPSSQNVNNCKRVCHRHFLPEDYHHPSLKGKWRRPSPDAVPSLFIWNNFQPPKERKQPALARKGSPLLTMTEDQGVVGVKIEKKSYAESDADQLAWNSSHGWQPDGMEFVSADSNITSRITPEGRNMEQISVTRSFLKTTEGVEYPSGVASHEAGVPQTKRPHDVVKLEIDSDQEVRSLIKREEIIFPKGQVETAHIKRERDVKSKPLPFLDYENFLQRDISSYKGDILPQLMNETEKSFAVKTEIREPFEESTACINPHSHSLSEPDWSLMSENQEENRVVKEEPEDCSTQWTGKDSTLMDGEPMKRAPAKAVYPTGLFKICLWHI